MRLSEGAVLFCTAILAKVVLPPYLRWLGEGEEGERRGKLEERRGHSQCIGLIRWLIASVAYTQRAHCQ